MSFEEVRDAIVEIVSCSEEEVTLTASLKEDLGMDSLDAMELVMLLEERAEVSIPEEKLPECVTVKDIVDYLESAKAA